MLGSPISHSLSPSLHRAAYAYLGLDWTYEAFTVERHELAEFVAALDEQWRGLSLTMPLKQVAVAVATELVQPVPVVGVANTLLLDGARRTALNTDISGMQAALAEAGVTAVPSATVVGGGSTAVAAVAALAPRADTVVACVRSPQRAGALLDLARRLGVRLVLAPWDAAPEHLAAPVVLSTTPAGATDSWVDLVPAQPGLLFDVVYDPWPTPFAQAWHAGGGAVLGGRDLLVHQAVGQVQAMTGRAVPIDVLRAAVQE